MQRNESNAEPVSRTAVWVAAARAIGAREPDERVRNPDCLAGPLLGDVSQYDVEIPIVHALDDEYDDAMQDPEIAGMVRTMIVRSRFIDDALTSAIEDGITQVLILGAGFDSHAYRFEQLLGNARVFELDRPKTLDMKRRRVQEVLGRLPELLTYIDADLQLRDLHGCLNDAGWDFAQRGFVIMEGLTMYLSTSAITEIFGQISSLAPGSRLVFDFVTDAMVSGLARLNPADVPAAHRASLEQFLHLIRDEPFRFGFPVGEEREYIEDLGLAINDLIMLDGDEAVSRYLTRADGSEVGQEGLAKRPPLPPEMARAQRQIMTYRICEAAVPGAE